VVWVVGVVVGYVFVLFGVLFVWMGVGGYVGYVWFSC